MSRKRSKRSSRRYNSYSVMSAPPLSMQELEAHWNSLRLQSQTRDHLESILQKEGLGLAFAATTALLLELEREEQDVTRSVWEWILEELRLLFLEEGCQHLIEAGRLVIDVSLTWTILWGPLLITRMVLPLLVLALLPLSLCLIHVLHQHRAGQK